MISKMKTGKAQDADGLTIEHIDYAHPALKLLLSKLFNYCLHAGVVPTRFGLGLTIPIPKNGSYRNSMNRVAMFRRPFHCWSNIKI